MAVDNQMTDEGNAKIGLHSERVCKMAIIIRLSQIWVMKY